MDRVLDKIKEFIKVFNVESIVVNDYGLLYRISKTEGLISEIILGRTLIRTIEDTPWYRLIVESEQEEVKIVLLNQTYCICRSLNSLIYII